MEDERPTKKLVNRFMIAKLLKYLITTIFILDSGIVLAESHWDSWIQSSLPSRIGNSSKNLEIGQIQHYISTATGIRNNSDYIGTTQIELPIPCLFEPLKPFQAEFHLKSLSQRFDLEFSVNTPLGRQSYTYTDQTYKMLDEGRIIKFTITYEVIKTLTIEAEIDNSKVVLKQFANVSKVNPMILTLKPHGIVDFISDNFNYRTMNLTGIEERTIAAAEMYHQSGKTERALEVLDQFIDTYKYTFSAQAYMYRAMSHAENGNYNKALEDINKSIGLAPCEFAYFIRGSLLLEKNDYSGINDLRKAGRIDQQYLNEHGLTESEYTASVANNHLSTPTNILASIISTRKNIKLSPKEIYNKYNDAVFMIFTKGLEGTSQGSGFFIGKNGLAISNYHVFEGAIRGREQVKLMNGGIYNVKEIIGYDKEKDYIIFRVEGRGFSYIPITKRGHEIGDEVYAIGSPRGMQNTLSNGLVSQKWDNVKFQISVPIDHGSSGGALINQYGEVIGITSGGRDDTHANLNYATDIRVIFNDNE